ncbi:MAG: carbon-nitrogen hydrolase family protein [Spirochaetales bacterium]|nr:carbon-nitrogen hydrolase family protein [Spirochaetales bacterium]
MKDTLLAICQNTTTHDKAKNISSAISMIEQAAQKKAQLVMLPEIFFYPYELQNLAAIAEEYGDTPALLSQKAKELGIFLCAGSLPIKEKGKLYNRACLFGPDGTLLLQHDKCHLFDVDLPDLKTSESAVFTPGATAQVVDTEIGTIGMLICYDIRFPELARKLALCGAEIILVPAAFNTITGPAHWHTLFRTRAIENQCYVAAASPARNNNAGYRAYGHSMVIDPWGEIIAEADIGEEIIYAELSEKKLLDTRSRLPLLKHRRPEIY